MKQPPRNRQRQRNLWLCFLVAAKTPHSSAFLFNARRQGKLAMQPNSQNDDDNHHLEEESPRQLHKVLPQWLQNSLPFRPQFKERNNNFPSMMVAGWVSSNLLMGDVWQQLLTINHHHPNHPPTNPSMARAIDLEDLMKEEDDEESVPTPSSSSSIVVQDLLSLPADEPLLDYEQLDSLFEETLENNNDLKSSILMEEYEGYGVPDAPAVESQWEEEEEEVGEVYDSVEYGRENDYYDDDAPPTFTNELGTLEDTNNYDTQWIETDSNTKEGLVNLNDVTTEAYPNKVLPVVENIEYDASTTGIYKEINSLVLSMQEDLMKVTDSAGANPPEPNYDELLSFLESIEKENDDVQTVSDDEFSYYNGYSEASANVYESMEKAGSVPSVEESIEPVPERLLYESMVDAGSVPSIEYTQPNNGPLWVESTTANAADGLNSGGASFSPVPKVMAAPSKDESANEPDIVLKTTVVANNPTVSTTRTFVQGEARSALKPLVTVAAPNFGQRTTSIVGTRVSFNDAAIAMSPDCLGLSQPTAIEQSSNWGMDIAAPSIEASTELLASQATDMPEKIVARQQTLSDYVPQNLVSTEAEPSYDEMLRMLESLTDSPQVTSTPKVESRPPTPPSTAKPSMEPEKKKADVPAAPKPAAPKPVLSSESALVDKPVEPTKPGPPKEAESALKPATPPQTPNPVKKVAAVEPGKSAKPAPPKAPVLSTESVFSEPVKPASPPAASAKATAPAVEPVKTPPIVAPAVPKTTSEKLPQPAAATEPKKSEPSAVQKTTSQKPPQPTAATEPTGPTAVLKTTSEKPTQQEAKAMEDLSKTKQEIEKRDQKVVEGLAAVGAIKSVQAAKPDTADVVKMLRNVSDKSSVANNELHNRGFPSGEVIRLAFSLAILLRTAAMVAVVNRTFNFPPLKSAENRISMNVRERQSDDNPFRRL